MKRITFIAALALCASAPAFARADGDGAEVYNKKCSSCHGKDGAGKTTMGEKLKVKDLAKTELDEAKIVATITDGIAAKKMPAFKEKLSDEEIKAAAQFVKTLKK